MLYYCREASPVGEITMVADEAGRLIWLALGSQRFFPDLSSAVEKCDFPVFNEVRCWLNAYFDGRNPGECSAPIAPKGSPFRQKIWQLLRKIHYGTTVSYGEIAREYARQESRRIGRDVNPCSQAVGNAIGHNPIAIIIPCHRVIGADGSLVGYGGGLDVKRYLLALEATGATGNAKR